MPVDLEPLRTKLEPVFLAEIDDALVSIDAGIERVRAGGDLDCGRDSMREALHAIRGSATTLGFDEVATYLGCVETRVQSQGQRQEEGDGEVVALLASVVEMMRDWIASIRDARPFDKARFAALPERSPPKVTATVAATDPDEEAASDIVTVGRETVERVFEHLMQLEIARTRLHHRVGRARFDSDLDELERHGRALRDLLRDLSPSAPTAYVDSQIVRVAGQRFVLPLSSVVEGRMASRERVVPLVGGRAVFEFRGSQVPIVDLASLTDDLGETPGNFLLVIDRPNADDQVVAPGPSRIALSVEAIEDAELVAADDVDARSPGDVFRGRVALASGSDARMIDLCALFGTCTEQGLRAPGARVPASQPPKPRSVATNAWRALARHSLNTNQGGRDGRYQ